MTSVVQNQADVFVRIKLITDATGAPATGVVAATAGHVIAYQRENAAVVTDSTSAADASALTDAHVDWEFDEIGQGYYQVAFPDAAFIEGAGSVLCMMYATGISCVAELVTIDHILKFYGAASSVTATTTTFAAGPNVYQGDSIYVMDGTGEGQTRLIKSVSGQVATHDAWTVNISATTSTIILIPGDQTLADGGINCDVLTSSRSSHTIPNVRTEIDASVAAGVNVTQVISRTLGENGSGSLNIGEI